MTLTPEQEAKFQKEIAEDKAKKAEEQKVTEDVLMAKVTSDGKVEWALPKDLRVALHLHKLLDVVISKIYEQNLSMSQPEPKKTIIQKVGWIFK